MMHFKEFIFTYFCSSNFSPTRGKGELLLCVPSQQWKTNNHSPNLHFSLLRNFEREFSSVSSAVVVAQQPFMDYQICSRNSYRCHISVRPIQHILILFICFCSLFKKFSGKPIAFFFVFFLNYYYLTQIKNIGYPRLVGYSTENHKIISLASANYTILTGEVTLVFETLFLIQQPFIQTLLSIIAPISAACI